MTPSKPPTIPRNIRLTADEWQMVQDIGQRWGPVVAVAPQDVIRELIRRENARLLSLARRLPQPVEAK